VPYLSKPCGFEVLIRTIEMVIKKRENSLFVNSDDSRGYAIFNGEVDLENYLLLLTCELTKAGVIEKSILPIEVINQLNQYHVDDALIIDEDLMYMSPEEDTNDVITLESNSGWLKEISKRS